MDLDPAPLWIAGGLVMLMILTEPPKTLPRWVRPVIVVALFVALVLAGLRKVIMQWLSTI